MSQLLFFGINNHQTISQNQPNQLQKEKQKQRLKQIKHTKLLIDPQKVNFLYQLQQKTIVSKVILKNNYSFKITFKIIQPKKSALSIKCKKFQLSSKQTIQIFIFFNTQKQKQTLQDEFIIFLQKQKIKLHIPIVCKPKRLRMSQARPSLLLKNTILYKNQGLVKPRSQTRLLSLTKSKKNINIDLTSYLNTIIMNFMEKYNQIHEFVKEKNVKKQIFIGEKALTYEKHKKIIQFNNQIKQFIQNTLKQKIQSRLTAQYSQQGPVVRNFQGLILRWNKQKNIPRMVYDKGLSKVQQQIRKYVVNLRFDKIHHIFSLYQQFESSNVNSHIPIQKRHQIYVQKLQKKLNKKSQTNLQLIFDKSSIIPQYFPLQYEIYSQKKSNHIFEINPRIGFDNWVAIQQSVPYIHEIMSYTKKQSIPQWQCHPKLQQNKSTKIVHNHSDKFNFNSNNNSNNNNSSKSALHNLLGINNKSKSVFSSNVMGNNQLDQLLQSLVVFKQLSNSSNNNNENGSVGNNKKQTLYSISTNMNNNTSTNPNQQKQRSNLRISQPNQPTHPYQPNSSSLSPSLPPCSPSQLSHLSSHKLSINEAISSNNNKQKQPNMINMIIDTTIKRFKQIRDQQKCKKQDKILDEENRKIMNKFREVYFKKEDDNEDDGVGMIQRIRKLGGQMREQQNNRYQSQQYYFYDYSYHLDYNKKHLPAIQESSVPQFFYPITQSLSHQQFILTKLSKPSYNIQLLSLLTYSKHEHQPYKQKPNKYFLQNYFLFKNSILRKLSKQDKYQFDRLDNKAVKILQWIQQNQDLDKIQNGKLRGEIQIQMPMKNKIKNYVNPILYEKHVDNLDLYKKNQIRKAQAIQVYLYQMAKNKNNAFLMQ